MSPLRTLVLTSSCAVAFACVDRSPEPSHDPEPISLAPTKQIDTVTDRAELAEAKAKAPAVVETVDRTEEPVPAAAAESGESDTTHRTPESARDADTELSKLTSAERVDYAVDMFRRDLEASFSAVVDFIAIFREGGSCNEIMERGLLHVEAETSRQEQELPRMKRRYAALNDALSSEEQEILGRRMDREGPAMEASLGHLDFDALSAYQARCPDQARRLQMAMQELMMTIDRFRQSVSLPN